MNYVKVYTKTYRDNSARYVELPSLLIEQDGETQIFEQLLRYQIKYSHKSRTWHNKLIQAVGLLFDYMNANPNNYVSAKDFPLSVYVRQIYLKHFLFSFDTRQIFGNKANYSQTDCHLLKAHPLYLSFVQRMDLL